jgi:hypothetical protein
MAFVLVAVVSASAEAVTLAWNANPEPNIAGYVIAYGTTSGTYPSTVDVGNRTTWQLTGLTGGQRYYFVVRAYNSTGALSPNSAEVDTHALSVSVTSNISPLPVIGQPISWVASSSSAAAEYAFYRFSSGVWTLVQDYSPLNTYTWTPTPVDAGSHQVQVWARVTGSQRSYNAWTSSGTFNILNVAVIVGSLESSVALPASTGTPISWKARAIGGPAPLQYKFLRYKESSGWTIVRDYGTNDTYTWTPGPGDEGTYTLQVWVRPNGSTADYVAWRKKFGSGTSLFNGDDTPGVARYELWRVQSQKKNVEASTSGEPGQPQQITGNAKAFEQGGKHPAEIAKIASGPDLFAAPIAFQNNSAGIRKVYGLDTNGERQLYRELKAGESYELGTYLSHPWVVTDADGNALGLYYPDGQKRTVTLE